MAAGYRGDGASAFQPAAAALHGPTIAATIPDAALPQETRSMIKLRSRNRRALVASAMAAALFAFAPAAYAGSCPADKMRADAVKPVNYPPKAVTDVVLSMIDLGQEKVGLKGHNMRVRRLEVQPGGVVPWHSHAERPALIYIVSGEIVENASNCAVPIVHKAGEVARETHATAHWWQNKSSAPVVLLSFDIQHDPNDKHM